MRVWNTAKAFTVVELLIVIVVIGILATLTIIGYSGVRQQAENATTITKAKELYKMIEGYRSVNNGTAPYSGSNICMTVDNLCTASDGSVVSNSSGTATLIANLSTIASPIRDTTPNVSGRYGIRYNNWAVRTFNGRPAALQMTYYLAGNGANCGIQNVRADDVQNSTTSTTGYTATDGTITYCVVSFYD